MTECDKEPIHIPGSIQPHGVLFALSEPELLITQASANTADLLGLQAKALLVRPLAACLHTSCSRTRRSWMEAEAAAHALNLRATIHRDGTLFNRPMIARVGPANGVPVIKSTKAG